MGRKRLYCENCKGELGPGDGSICHDCFVELTMEHDPSQLSETEIEARRIKSNVTKGSYS